MVSTVKSMAKEVFPLRGPAKNLYGVGRSISPRDGVNVTVLLGKRASSHPTTEGMGITEGKVWAKSEQRE